MVLLLCVFAGGAYEYPSAVVGDRKLKTVHDTLISIGNGYPISLDSVHSKLLLFFGEQPLSTTGVTARKVGQKEHRSNSTSKCSGTLNDE